MKNVRDSLSVSSIHRLAEQQRKFTYLLGGLGLMIALLAAIVLAAYSDTIWVLPKALRWALLGVGLVGALAGGLWVYFRATRHSVRSAAATFEAAHPEVGQRIRTAVDLEGVGRSESPEAAALRRQLAQETRADLVRFSWKDLIPKKLLILSLVGLASLGLVTVIGLTHSEDFRIGFQRVLNPATDASYTNLAWAQLPTDFDERKPIHLGVEVSRRVSEPKIFLRPAGEENAEWEEVSLTALDERGKWDAILSDRRSSLELYAEAGDARTPVKTIQYHPLPKLLSSKVHVTYPDYLGKPAETMDRGDVKAIEGTEVTWEFAFDHPPLRTEWQLGPKVDDDLKVDPSDGLFRTGHQLTASKLNASLTIYAYDGEPVSTWRYQVEGLVDEMPKVGIFEPKKEMQATPVAEFPVRIRATDDYGVAEIGLVLESAGEKDWILEEVVDATDQKRIDRMLHAMLEKVPLTIQDNVRLYAYALDHKPRGGPRAVSHLVPVEIVPFKIRSVWGGQVQAASAKCLQEKLMKLNQIVKTQRRIVSDLFKLKEESDNPSREELVKLGHEENRISYEAQRIHRKWVSLGDLPLDDLNLLSVAIAQMDEAYEHLLRNRAQPGFVSADRALSSLLRLRKKWIKIIRKCEGDCDRDSDCDSESGSVDLLSLAAEAERLAREEADVNRQLGVAEPKLEILQRQQELVVADTGELFAKLVNHPQVTRGALTLMEIAELAAVEANDVLHADEYEKAGEFLTRAENGFADLADFLRALELKSLTESLRKLAEKAEKNSKEVKKAAEAKSPKDKEGKKKGEKKGEKKGDKKGKKPGEKTPGQKPGSKPGGTKPGGTKPGSVLSDATRETDLMDQILKDLIEKLEKSSDPSGQAKKEALEKLAGKAGVEELAKKLKGLGKQAEKGELDGQGKKALEEAAKDLKRLSRLAKETAKELEASKLQKLVEAREAGEALMKALKGLPKDGPFAEELDEETNGEGTGNTAKLNKKKNALGVPTTRFVDRLEKTGDRELQYFAQVYQRVEMDRSMIHQQELVLSVIEREIAKIPIPAVSDEAPKQIPHENRREIEDYFRDLSDDLEDDGLTSLPR